MNVEKGVCIAFACLALYLAVGFYSERPPSIIEEIEDRPARAALPAGDIFNIDPPKFKEATYSSIRDIFIPVEFASTKKHTKKATTEGTVATAKEKQNTGAIKLPPYPTGEQKEETKADETKIDDENAANPFPLKVLGFIKPKDGQPRRIIVTSRENPGEMTKLADGDMWESEGRKIKLVRSTMTTALFEDENGLTVLLEKDAMMHRAEPKSNEEPAENFSEPVAKGDGKQPRKPDDDRMRLSPDMLKKWQEGKIPDNFKDKNVEDILKNIRKKDKGMADRLDQFR